MTLEERICRSLGRLAVVERLLALEGLEGAVHITPLIGRPHIAGMRELIDEAYHELSPIENAPFAVTNWEPEADTQPEPSKTAGEHASPPAAG